MYAPLAGGTTIQIRPAGAADFAAVKAMHEALPVWAEARRNCQTALWYPGFNQPRSHDVPPCLPRFVPLSDRARPTR